MGSDNNLARRKPVPMPTVLKAELPTAVPGSTGRNGGPPAGDTDLPGREPAPAPAVAADEVGAGLLATGVLFGAGAVFGMGAVVGASGLRRLRRRLGPTRR